MVSILKLPILKTKEYDLWSMRMEQYLTFTNHVLWKVIVNDDSVSSVASAFAEGPIPPKNAEENIARKNELKAKSTLMLAILDEHLLKFHACKDAKSLWEVIKNRFGGNKESKKMQKTILKQNYENFVASSQEGLDKTYDRFQKLISQLEIHGEVISHKDANLKFLRSLPSAWKNFALIMRNKSDLDTLRMDGLYNNLKVYESEIKIQSSSSSNSQNVAFVSSDISSSTNETINTAHSVSAANLEQIDTDDLKEMDLKWQVAMLTIRVKRFIKKTRRKLDLNGKDIVGFDITKVECYTCHRRCHFARECRALRNQGNRNRDAPTRNAPVNTSTINALVIQDGIGGYDWSFQAEEKLTNFALIVYTSQGSSSSDSKLENALREKDDLKLKLEKFETSFKNLTKLIDSQINATNKTGLGYDGQMNKSDLNDIHVNKSEVLNNVVDSCESGGNDNQVNDRFKKGEGYHAVPPSYTGNYMPPRADLSFARLDNSVFKSKVSETITSVPKIETNASKTSKDSLEKPKTVRNKTIENENKAKKPRKFSQSPKVLTKSGQVPVNAAKQSSQRAAASVSAARHDQGIFNNGCSRHMTGNKFYLSEYQEIDGGFVAFGGNAKGGKITGKGRKLALIFMRPFGCPVTILNTLDHLGNQTNGNAGTKANIDAGQARKKSVPGPQYVLIPLLTSNSQGPQSSEDEVVDDAEKKKTHTLIWRNKADLEEQSLDDLFNSLKIYEAKVKHSSSTGTTTQNLAFLSSFNTDNTTELVSDAASVSVVCAKMPMSFLPNVDSLSNAVIYSFFASQSSSPQLDNEDLKQIDVDDLEEMDLKWKIAMDILQGSVGSYDWSFQAEAKPANYALMAFSSSSSSSDNEVFTRAIFDCDDYLSSESDESWPPSSPYDRFQPSDGYHVVPLPYTGTFMPPKPDLVFNTAPTAVETDHPTFTVQLSPTKPEQDLSHTNRPTSPIIEDWVSDFEDEFETKAPQIVPSFVQSIEQVKSPRHSVQHVETSIPAATPNPASLKPASSGKRRNRKACFVCKSVDHLIKDCDYHEKQMAKPTAMNHAHKGNHKHYASMTHHNPQKHMVPVVVLTQSKPVSITDVRPVSTAIPKTSVTRPKQVKPIVTKPKSPIRRHLTRSPSPKTSNSPLRVTTVKALVGNPQHALKNKGVIDSGCSRYMIGNISYLSDFEELNGRYVAFGGNPKGGKISGKGKIKTCNLVRGLTTKVFENDNTYIACKKGKQHRASCKNKPVSFVDQPIDLFGPNFVKSLNKKSYCLVVTDDYSRFTWVFFLATKDETSPILKTFITILENQLSLRVKVIRSDSGIEFKNHDLNQFYGMKGIQVLVTKPHNKTPYELLHGRTPSIGFMRPFGYPVTILNTLDSLGKFDGKVDEGFLVGYSVSSKAFRVFNSRTCIVQETLHVNFLENKPNLAGFQDKFAVEKAGEEIDQQYVLFPMWSSGSTNPHNTNEDVAFDGKEPKFDEKMLESEVNVSPSSSAPSRKQDDNTKKEAKGKSHVDSFTGYIDLSAEFEDYSNDNIINEVNVVGTLVPTVGQISLNSTNTFSDAGPSNAAANPTYGKSLFIDASQLPDDPDMPELEDITYSDNEDDVGTEADFNNLETSIIVSPIPTTRVHKDHLVTQIIGDLSLTTQTRSMIKVVKDQGRLSQMFNDDFHTCMFACFLSQEEPKRVHQALKDPSWIEAMQEELLQFKIQKVWILVDFPYGKRAIVARIEAIRLFLAYASFMGFMVYQMDVKSAFLYGTIKEEVYVCQPLRFEDPDNPDKVYKVVKALYGLHQAPRACQDKYVAEILRKFGLQEGKSASTPIDTDKPLLKDPNVDKKKVVITEATIREAPHLNDKEGVDWLSNEEIFAELARMGYEKPSIKFTFYKAFFSSQWKKFNFSKYIFDNLVRNVASPTKFYMYPRFLQLMIRKQVGKRFSGVKTPLFESMLVEQQVAKEGDADENNETVNAGDAAEGDVTLTKRVNHLEFYKVAQALEITKLKRRVKKLERRNKVRKLKFKRLQRVGTSQRVETSNETVLDDVSNRGRMIVEIDQDDVVVMEDDKEKDREVADAIKDIEEAKEDETKPAKVQKVVDVVTTAKLITKVVTAASETITAASTIITSAEAQVLAVTLTAAPVRVTVAPSRRRKCVVITDPNEESTTSTIIPAETKSKDKDKGILVEEPKPLKKKQQIKQDEQYARELQAELNKNIDWDEAIDHMKQKAKEDPAVKRYQMDYFKGISYDDIRLIFKTKFNSNVAFLLKIKEHIEEDENRALQKINKTLVERAAKRRKLDEEVEELKRHLHIVPNEDDDVYTKATPLARKVPVVDYQIIEINNKPYYKIIRADDTHQLYEIFSTTKPKNFSDDFLLVTLGEMFKKPNIHAQIWKTRRNVHGPAKVKGWKLLESCGVQIITFTSTQLILLVERKNPLIIFTLNQMLNAVRLEEVEEESEVSLELLRFTRQQHREGQLE
nr:hypothetical protein [Tanacetum cinerariifolium]